MMKQFNREVGKKGEEIAAEYLKGKKYKIIENNYQTKFGEIDLICSHSTDSGHETLHFVEVKLKQGEDFGTPEEMIGKDKLGRVQRMAEYFLMENPGLAQKYQTYSLDAVCVVINNAGKVERINLYENLGFE